MADVEIKVRDGPYRVTGPITLINADGSTYEVEAGKPVALRRCGGSTTKPFCDGTPSKAGFEAAERSTNARHAHYSFGAKE